MTTQPSFHVRDARREGLGRRVTSPAKASGLSLLRDLPPPGVRHGASALLMRMLWPGTLLRRSFLGNTDLDWSDRRSFDIELPAGNGVGTARAIARAYSAFAEGGAELGITPETFARVTALPVVAGRKDGVFCNRPRQPPA